MKKKRQMEKKWSEADFIENWPVLKFKGLQ